MKKNILVTLLLVTTFFNSFSQNKTSDVFNSAIPITWLGIDYSHTKFIGPATGWGDVSTKSPTEMRDNYFPAWNQLILNEPEKYKVAEAVGRTEVTYFPQAVANVNEKINKGDIFSESISDYQLLDDKEVASMVKKYDYKGKTGIGFALIAQGMSKGLKEASYWAVFVDMGSKKLIFSKQISGDASGFGFRNYWAGSVKSVFKKMKKEFKNWR